MVQTAYLGSTAFSNVTVGSTTVTAVYVGSTKIWEAGSSWTDPDIANASYDSVSFALGSQDSGPLAIFLKDDGSKLYMLGFNSDRVHQYSLSTAFDLSTMSYDNVFFSVSSQDGVGLGLAFNTSGTKMFVLGTSTDKVYQYSLSTAWDASTLSYDSVSFSVATQETSPRGLTFSPDGTDMYIVGDNEYVYQYSLSTAFDLSTASYSNTSFDVSSQETSLKDVRFNPDGVKMYILGSGGDKVYQYSLSTAYDVSTASYDSISFSVSSEDGSSYSILFNNDGSKMYILGTSNDTVYQYSTVAPAAPSWTDPDIANTSYDSVSFSVTNEEITPTGIQFKPDGTKMYIIGLDADSVIQYNLSTAWDITSASYSQSFSVSTEDSSPQDLYFKADGTEVYIVGISSDKIHQYSLSTAWDISSASFTGSSGLVGDNTPRGLHISPDGTHVYVCGDAVNRVYEFELTTAWDITTLTSVTSIIIQNEDTNPQGVWLNPDGTKMYLTGGNNDDIFQYSLSTAWDLSTASYDSISFDMGPQDGGITGSTAKADGSKIYAVGNTNDKIFQYST